MKKVKWICDCCGKEDTNEWMKLKLPIRDLNGKGNLMPSEMDICFECADKIADTYYKTAKENGQSGIKRI